MSSMTTMPFEVLQRILRFVSDPVDLLHCELTCKSLHDVVSNDETWSFCESISDSRVSTHRESACIYLVFGRIQEHQRKSDNILVSVLGVQGFKDLVYLVLRQLLPDYLTDHNRYFLRGDTTAYLVDLIQETLVWQFRRANLVCCDTFPNDAYPVLTEGHLQLQDKLIDPLLEELGAQRLVPKDRTSAYNGVEVIDFANTLIAMGDRDKIIRNVASRAGVVKMTNSTFDFAWGSVVQLIATLLKPACILLHSRDIEDSNLQKQVLGPLESIHMVPPIASTQLCEHCQGTILVHTPVPKQLEEAASKLYIPGKIYGNFWLAQEGATKEYEMEVAEEGYVYEEEDDDRDGEAGSVASEAEDSSDEGLFQDDDDQDDSDQE